MVKIIYASTSGNVEIVCEKIAEIFNESGIETKLMRSEQTSIDEILNHDLFVLATSTWEHGEINQFYLELLGEITKNDMTGKKAAFVGLGDRRYEPVLFCKGIDILQDAFLKQGGSQVGEALKIDGEPYGLFESVVSEWTKQLLEYL